MNEIQIYSAIMFFAGVVLTHAIFYFQQKKKEKDFLILYSAVALQALESLYLQQMSNIEMISERTERDSGMDETELAEYLRQEGSKVEVFMEIYTMLMIRALPKGARKLINFSNWTQAKSLIEKTRRVMKNGKDKG